MDENQGGRRGDGGPESLGTGPESMNLVLGEKVFVRTVTDHWVGRIAGIYGPYTVGLTEAAWIAESGRLHVFVRDGKAEGMEVEVVGTIKRVQYLAILPWKHELFKESV